MSWWTEYDDLDLDEIYQITDADNSRAPEMDEQAGAVRELALSVQSNLDRLQSARKQLGIALVGLSGRAGEGRATDLGDKTSAAADRLGRHESTFVEVAELARETHAELSRLRRERDESLERLRDNPSDPTLMAEYGDGWTGLHPALVETAIRERFDEDAREQMRTSGDAYLSRAESLEPVESYDGPRSSASMSWDGGDSGGTSGRTAAGPSMTRTADVAGAESGSAGAPELQGATAVAAPPTPAPGYLAPQGGYFLPTTVVTPPVIGARPTVPSTGAARTPSLRPSTTGFTKSVFGERPGKAFNSFGQRQPQPVVRPSPGVRSATLPGQVAGRGLPSGAGPVRPVPGRTAGSGPVIGGRRGPAVTKPIGTGPRAGGVASSAPSGPGARAVPAAEHRAVGRVFRGGPGERKVERAEFARRPKASHGGTDGLNRPVVRNSRALSTPVPAREPAPEPDPVARDREPESELWPTGTSAVVPPVIRPRTRRHDGFDHDPGFFLTPRNLGRGPDRS